MYFTKYHSMRDILSCPGMEEYLNIFFSRDLLAMFPAEHMDKPLAYVEQVAKTPWNDPFSVIADQFLDAVHTIQDIVENHSLECISLWKPDKICWTPELEKRGGEDSVFLMAPVPLPSMEGEKKPAALICPGGGYEAVCFSGEGNPVRYFMEANGYRAFVLKYRVYPPAGKGKDTPDYGRRYPDPQLDLTLAMMYLRTHAGEYGIDPDNILLMGASAGGHLCALTSALHRDYETLVLKELKSRMPLQAAACEQVSALPDRLCLFYPVISFEDEPHEGSFQALTGGDAALRGPLSVDKLVTGEFPKTFLWTLRDDDCVPPSNTVRMAESLKRHNVPCRMRLYPSGGHGCNLAFCKEARDWSGEMLQFMKESFQEEAE